MDSQIYQEDVDRMFKEGLTIVVFNWPIIKLVMQNGWVGKNQVKIRDDIETKQEHMESEFSKSEDQVIHEFIEDLFSYVVKFECKRQDLEEWLTREILDRFFIVIEDNSEKEISKVILKLFDELEDKQYSLYEEIKKMGITMKLVKVQGRCNNNDEDDSDDEDSSQQEGWEDSSQIGPDDVIELTEEQVKKNQEKEEEENRAMLEEQEQLKKKQEMEEDGFTVVPNKKNKKRN